MLKIDYRDVYMPFGCINQIFTICGANEQFLVTDTRTMYWAKDWKLIRIWNEVGLDKKRKVW